MIAVVACFIIEHDCGKEAIAFRANVGNVSGKGRLSPVTLAQIEKTNRKR